MSRRARGGPPFSPPPPLKRPNAQTNARTNARAHETDERVRTPSRPHHTVVIDDAPIDAVSARASAPPPVATPRAHPLDDRPASTRRMTRPHSRPRFRASDDDDAPPRERKRLASIQRASARRIARERRTRDDEGRRYDPADVDCIGATETRERDAFVPSS